MQGCNVLIAAMLLLAGVVTAQAAPSIPPSELPGRERERFRESPLDRFTQPRPPDVPLLRSTPRASERPSRHRCNRPARERC